MLRMNGKKGNAGTLADCDAGPIVDVASSKDHQGMPKEVKGRFEMTVVLQYPAGCD